VLSALATVVGFFESGAGEKEKKGEPVRGDAGTAFRLFGSIFNLRCLPACVCVRACVHVSVCVRACGHVRVLVRCLKMSTCKLNDKMNERSK